MFQVALFVMAQPGNTLGVHQRGGGTHLRVLQWEELLTRTSTWERDKKERRQTERACLCDSTCVTPWEL